MWYVCDVCLLFYLLDLESVNKILNIYMLKKKKKKKMQLGSGGRYDY